MEQDLSLAIDTGGELLFGAAGDLGIAEDELLDRASHRLDSKREGGDIQKEQVIPITGENIGLERRPQRDHLVGVEVRVGCPTKQRRDRRANRGDACGAAHQHHLVDLVCAKPGIGEALAAGGEGALDQGRDLLLKSRTGKRKAQ